MELSNIESITPIPSVQSVSPVQKSVKVITQPSSVNVSVSSPAVLTVNVVTDWVAGIFGCVSTAVNVELRANN